MSNDDAEAGHPLASTDMMANNLWHVIFSDQPQVQGLFLGVFFMRILLTALLLTSFMPLAMSSSFAKTPCKAEIEKASAIYNNIRQKALNTQKKGMVKDVDILMKKARKALEEGDEKTCHNHTKKIITKSKKIK